MLRSRVSLLVLALLLVGVVGCSALAPEPTPTPTPLPTKTPIPPTPTLTVTPSPTVLPTNTPIPTATPIPEVDAMGFPGAIVFTALTSDGPRIYAYVFDLKGYGPVIETENNAVLPYWSPDGRKIAFMQYNPAADRQELWVWDVEAGGQTRRIGTTQYVPVTVPHWSPDSRYLAFDMVLGAGPDIFVADMETDGIRQLTTRGKWEAFPTWSPDSQQIAFVSDREGLDNIYLMNVDGSDQHPLVNHPDWENTKPAWAPDGETIAFFRWSMTHEDSDEGGPGGLWGVLPDGSEEWLISAEANDGILAHELTWSPDGTKLAYTSLSTIQVVDVETGGRITVATATDKASSLSWSSDSRALTYSEEPEDGAPSLFVVMADGSAQWKLVEGAVYGHWADKPQ